MAANRLLIPVLLIACATLLRAEKPLVPCRACTRPECLGGIPWAEYQYRPRSSSETAISRIGILLRTSTTVTDAAEPGRIALKRAYTDEQVYRHFPDKNENHIEQRIDVDFYGSDAGEAARLPFLEESVRRLPPPLDTGVPNPAKPGVRRRVLTNNFTARLPAKEPPKKTVVELYQLDRPRLQIDHCEISQVALQLHDGGGWVLSLRADQNRRPGEDEAPEFNPHLHLKRNQFVVKLRCLGAFQEEPSEAAMATGKPVLATLSPSPFWVQNGQPRYLRVEGLDPWVEEHFKDIDRVEIEFFYYRHHGAPSPAVAE